METKKAPVPLMLFKNEAYANPDGDFSNKVSNIKKEIETYPDHPGDVKLNLDDIKYEYDWKEGLPSHDNGSPSSFGHPCEKKNTHLGQPSLQEKSRISNDNHTSSSSFGPLGHLGLPTSYRLSQDTCIEATTSSAESDTDVDIETIPDTPFYSSILSNPTTNHQHLLPSSSAAFLSHQFVTGCPLRKGKRPGPKSRTKKSFSSNLSSRKQQSIPSNEHRNETLRTGDIDPRDPYHVPFPPFEFHNYAKDDTRHTVDDLDAKMKGRGTTRLSHNTNERVRRQKLAYLFFELANEIPGLANNPKATKIGILSQAAAYIKQLESFLQIQDHITARETARNETLREMLQYLQLQSYPIVALRKL